MDETAHLFVGEEQIGELIDDTAELVPPQIALRLAPAECQNTRLTERVAPARRLEIERAQESGPERQQQLAHVERSRQPNTDGRMTSHHSAPSAGGANSSARAQPGTLHGCCRKNVYAKTMVPVNATHGTDGAHASIGTSQTAYHGKTFGLRSSNPPTSNTARSASGAARCAAP